MLKFTLSGQCFRRSSFKSPTNVDDSWWCHFNGESAPRITYHLYEEPDKVNFNIFCPGWSFKKSGKIVPGSSANFKTKFNRLEDTSLSQFFVDFHGTLIYMNTHFWCSDAHGAQYAISKMNGNKYMNMMYHKSNNKSSY